MSGISGSEEKYPTTIKQLEVMRKIAEEYYKEHPAEKEEETRTERLLRKGKPNRFSVGRDIVLPIVKFVVPVLAVIGVALHCGRPHRRNPRLPYSLARRSWTPIPNDLLQQRNPFTWASRP